MLILKQSTILHKGLWPLCKSYHSSFHRELDNPLPRSSVFKYQGLHPLFQRPGWLEGSEGTFYSPHVCSEVKYFLHSKPPPPPVVLGQSSWEHNCLVRGWLLPLILRIDLGCNNSWKFPKIGLDVNRLLQVSCFHSDVYKLPQHALPPPPPQNTKVWKKLLLYCCHLGFTEPALSTHSFNDFLLREAL